MDTLLSVEQAAERLGTSLRFVRRLVFERRIAYVKLGHHVRIVARDLDAFVRARRVEVGELPSLRRGGLTMAHIERRVRNGKTSYRARSRDPAGRENAKVFARKADAQRFPTEMENSELKGPWTDPVLGRVLFRKWFGEWQRTTARLRPNTEARDERLFRLHVLPHFGPMPLARIGQRDVRAWVAGLTAKGLAASTVQRCYQLLSKVMAAAVDAGMIPQTPCRRLPLPRIERKEMRFLSPLRSGSWPTPSGRSIGR